MNVVDARLTARVTRRERADQLVDAELLGLVGRARWLRLVQDRKLTAMLVRHGSCPQCFGNVTRSQPHAGLARQHAHLVLRRHLEPGVTRGRLEATALRGEPTLQSCLVDPELDFLPRNVALEHASQLGGLHLEPSLFGFERDFSRQHAGRHAQRSGQRAWRERWRERLRRERDRSARVAQPDSAGARAQRVSRGDFATCPRRHGSRNAAFNREPTVERRIVDQVGFQRGERGVETVAIDMHDSR